MEPKNKPAPPSVLIVDDDAPTRRLVRTTLGDDAYCIAETGDGYQALRLIGRIRPQVIVLDVDLGMPDLNGLDICRLIREESGFEDVQIILLTGHDSDDLRTRAQEFGVETYFTKPFSPTALVNEVDRLLGL